MTASELASAVWRKSTRSNGTGQYVEVAVLEQAIAVRDSKQPDGHVLLPSHTSWTDFLQTAKTGHYDAS
jgi:hypothetical protein